MSTEKTDALVIRQADFSETSKVVTFFTRDLGRISAVAKGGRRLKGPFEAALDLLTHCRIVFIRKSSAALDILTEAQVISRFRPNEKSLTSLYAGYYLAELLSELTAEYDPHPQLFDETVAALAQLAVGADPQLTALQFELVLLRELGQLPVFDRCVGCDAPVTPKGKYGFWVSQGGLICERCRKEEYGQLSLTPDAVRILQHLSGGSTSTINRLSVSPDQFAQIRRVVTSAISHILGRRPKLTRYLKL